jgi:hypothetical protein
LLNPDNAGRCDCGYDFNEGIMKRSHVEAAEEHKAASKFQELVELHGSVEAAWKVVGKRNMIRGTGWLLGGSILSGAYYMIAVQQANETGRGTYWFLTGALVVGIGQFVLGLRQYFRRA